MQLDHYLEEEQLEQERQAAIRKWEGIIKFDGMMATKLRKQKEEEDKDKAGPSGV